MDEKKDEIIPRRIVINARWEIITELSYVGLPLLFITFVYFHAGKYFQLLEIPEWAFAAMVLSVQTVTSFGNAQFISNDKEHRNARVGFLLAAIVACDMAPSFLVLSFILTEEARNSNHGGLSTGLIIAQIITFFIALAFYILFVGTAKIDIAKKAAKEVKRPNEGE